MDIISKQKVSVPRDDDDRDFLIRQKGFEEGLKHQSSSPETKEALKKMGEDITQLKVSTARIETKVDGIIDTLNKHIEEEARYREEQTREHEKIIAEKANVWTEKVLIGAGSVIGVTILGALLSLILIK